ncbi:hypothetical protein OG978_07705 [Streptomyces sp. NBC_01591]|uniref:hypothetical protein n=1 Tax=Streptomyces sp. NBC_01591 TaxID=2975888 RepID=UPI002DD958A2|nr:hypothetical protein [Streptomyces sp. NBC_01591]WSD67279.1 hypothetical protein OG978_07705 [Streptomyces sp. NBC_01591]
MDEFLLDFQENIDDVEGGAYGLPGQARQLARRAARELMDTAPPGWQSLSSVFALTATAERSTVVVVNGGRSTQIEPSPSVLALVREHREVSAGLGDGPWWRLLLELSDDGELDVTCDFGKEPFPDEQLFPPEKYREDLAAYPRTRLPVWLAAYVHHNGRQRRTPQQAAAAARADRRAKVWPVLSVNDFPGFPGMWARWAVISAAFVAAGSDWGPRMLPSMGWFESSRRGGSTLYRLPDGRAVLSGGVWDAPALDTAYNGGEQLPDLYAGAPDWVANQVLNPRAETGLLSFCYWWDAGQWHRGESASAEESATAVPGVWTAGTVAGIVAGLIGNTGTPGEDHRAKASTLVSAVENGVVTRETLVAAFGDDGRSDIDGALYQLSLAGLVTRVPQPMHEEDALARVRQYMLSLSLNSPEYSVSELVADRFSVGWMIYVPVPRGEMAIGRAIFYVTDDGAFKRSSSSVAPSVAVAELEEEFYKRQRGKRQGDAGDQGGTPR